MTWRLLILSVAFACATAQAPFAFAKPPEEEAAERAERAAERAAKAAERAADSADRAADREARDRKDGGGKDGDRAKDHDDRDRKSADRTRESGNGDFSGQLIQVKGADEDKDDEADRSTSGGGDARDEETDSDADKSTSGGNVRDEEEEDNSGSNSGSGSSGSSGSSGGSDDDDNEDDDHSGHGSGDDDGSDDDDDDNNKRDQHATFVALENDEAGNPFRDGELVVMSDDAALLNRAEALGFAVIESRPLESIGALVARLRRPEGVSSNEALAMLRTREPGSPSGYNYIYRATGNAPETPDEDRREPQSSPSKPVKSAIKVGVIDGFSADTVSGWAVDRLVDKPAKAGHGDAVTGILLRDLETGYRISPDKLLLLDVMREHPGGGAADVAALVFAFDKLVTAKVDVANLSLAGPDHPALRLAVSKSMQKGLVVVAAVGNGGPAAAPAFPAAYDGVIGVAAVDATGKPYIYSGRGPHVDIAALGVEVDSKGTGGELVGTSYAAPHVSALLAGMTKAAKPGSVDKLLAQYAEDAGAPGRDPVYGMGILAPDRPARLALAADGKTSN